MIPSALPLGVSQYVESFSDSQTHMFTRKYTDTHKRAYVHPGYMFIYIYVNY